MLTARSMSLSAAPIFIAATPGSPASSGRPRSNAFVTVAAAARRWVCAAARRVRMKRSDRRILNIATQTVSVFDKLFDACLVCCNLRAC